MNDHKLILTELIWSDYFADDLKYSHNGTYNKLVFGVDGSLFINGKEEDLDEDTADELTFNVDSDICIQTQKEYDHWDGDEERTKNLIVKCSDKDGARLYRIAAHYCSWEGTHWGDATISEVKAVEKTIIEYIPV